MSRNGFRRFIVGFSLLAGLILGSLPASAECPGDFDGSGQVSVDDLNAFFTAWFAIPQADFNEDGEVNEDDLNGFLADFFAGLPSADFNGDGYVTTNDLFSYLQVYIPVINSPSTDFDNDGVIVNDNGDVFAFIAVWSQPC